MRYSYDSFATPLGEFSVAVDETGAVTATAFGSVERLQERLAHSLDQRDPAIVATAREQIRAYFAGELREYTLPLAPIGSPFQQRVWTALQQIPFGQTRSYGELARQLGNPNASRAVGRANATNPICLVVPCHRVIGADGSMTGFAFGEEIKRRLLTHEGVI